MPPRASFWKEAIIEFFFLTYECLTNNSVICNLSFRMMTHHWIQSMISMANMHQRLFSKVEFQIINYLACF